MLHVAYDGMAYVTIQLLVILLGQIITSNISFGHVIAYFGTGGDRTYFSDEV